MGKVDVERRVVVVAHDAELCHVRRFLDIVRLEPVSRAVPWLSVPFKQRARA